MLTEKQLKSAVKRYNDIMMCIGCEHNTINTELSEQTNDWNLRDMVAECDYMLSCYYEQGHCRNDMRYDDSADVRRLWKSETGRLARFISHYEPYVKDMRCEHGHCSRFD